MAMDFEKLRDKCRGSIVGGAVGDALGYEVEFMDLGSIRRRFGAGGITRYVLHGGVARFSDDTQMTLFTIEGLLSGRAGSPEGARLSLRDAYVNWYRTQTERPHALPESRLSRVGGLWSRRAPGLTCLSALENIANGFEADNDSKGCGGVMRVAPVGLYFGCSDAEADPAEKAMRLAAKAGGITHLHPASDYSCALLALVVYECMRREQLSRDEFIAFVRSGLGRVREALAAERSWAEFEQLIRRAVDLGSGDEAEEEAIRELGEGWVADEALAIALFAVVRHFDDFEACVVCAVNHDGDSDSTGAIAGNIIGAIHGLSAIPVHYLETLELKPLLISSADELCDCKL